MHHCLKTPAASSPLALSQPRCAAPLPALLGSKQHARLYSADPVVSQVTETRRAQCVCTRAVDTKSPEAQTSSSESAPSSPSEEFYEVSIKKPLGFTLARGNDGGTYIQRTDGEGNSDPRIKSGDKVVQVSASFGDDVWDAGKFGQVLYAIKTRNGEVYLKLLDRKGDTSCFDERSKSEQEKYYNERDGGNYGYSTKEWQRINYNNKKETEKKRISLFDGALAQFKKGDIKSALIDFEEVIALEPKNFKGEDLSRVTNIYRVAQYNIACCYSALEEVEAGLEALKAALDAGFEQFGKVRTDPNLEKLRTSPKFEPLVDKYDEPVISSGAMKALKNIFSFGK